MSVAIHNPFPTIIPEMMPKDSGLEELLLLDPDSLEMPEQEGCLRAEGKQYTFSSEGPSKAVMQSLQQCFTETFQTKEQKTFEAKTTAPVSFKMDEAKIRMKELKASETEKTDLQSQENLSSSKQLQQMSQSAKQIFSKTLQQHLMKGETAAKTSTPSTHGHLANFTGKMGSLNPSSERKAASDPNANKAEARRPENTQTPPLSPALNREIAKEAPDRPQDYEKNEEQKEKRQQQEEERGSTDQEKQREHSSQEQEEDEGDLCVAKSEESQRTTSTGDETELSEFDQYAMEESILSEIFKMRVSHFDVLVLFIEILKLEIRSREQERISRMQERELQILHMQKVVDNYKQQGRFLLFANLGAGLMAIGSGACPIIGHVGGTWILGKLTSVFSGLRGMDKDQLFKSLTKVLFHMSEMYKSTGQIQQTFAESSRTLDQHLSDLHRTDHEENTRTMEEIKDFWKNIENFLFETLRMVHEAIRQLYNI